MNGSIDSVEEENHETIMDASLALPLWFLSCGFLGCPYSTIIRLGQEEVTRYDKTLCGERITVRQYGAFGALEISVCCCFMCVDSDIGTLMPSYGCDRDAVNCIANELRERISNQGETALTTAIDSIHDQTNSIHAKTDILLQHIISSNDEVFTKTMTMDDR